MPSKPDTLRSVETTAGKKERSNQNCGSRITEPRSWDENTTLAGRNKLTEAGINRYAGSPASNAFGRSDAGRVEIKTCREQRLSHGLE